MKKVYSTLFVLLTWTVWGTAAAAQQCQPGTIQVWVQNGRSLQMGCSSFTLTSKEKTVTKKSVAGLVVYTPEGNLTELAHSDLVASGLVGDLADISKQLQKDEETLKQADSTIRDLQKQVSTLKAAQDQANQTIQSIQASISKLQDASKQQSVQQQNSNGQGYTAPQYNPPNYVPPNYTVPSNNQPNNQTDANTETILYAPLEVKSKKTGTILFKLVENGNGGRILVFNSVGAEIASIGASVARDSGSVAVQTPNGQSHAGLAFNGNIGFLQIDSDGKNLAELGSGIRSPMGLHLWNTTSAEVVSLEAMPDGNGGLRIGNSKGGTAATIAPNHDGVGIFHGITAAMPIGQP